jgi:hypothetical protein
MSLTMLHLHGASLIRRRGKPDGKHFSLLPGAISFRLRRTVRRLTLVGLLLLPLVRAFSLHLIVTLVLLAAPRLSAAQGQILYVYDDLNRLSAVVKQQGDVAVDTCDADCDILKIERSDATGASGAPAAGRAGTVTARYKLPGTAISRKETR